VFKEVKRMVGWQKEEAEERASHLCRCCINQKDVTVGKKIVVEDKVTGTPIEFYCKAGHDKPNFECKDFETTRQLVRDMISNFVDELYVARKGSSKRDGRDGNKAS
jgi:hypothetical protein